jgi:hypothetical protein
LSADISFPYLRRIRSRKFLKQQQTTVPKGCREIPKLR